MDWTEAGVWLVGIGTALGVAVALLSIDRAAEGGLTFSGALASTRGRLRLALEVAGVLHAAAGALILAVVEFGEWWFALCTVGTVSLTVYAILVWKQYEYRRDCLRGWSKALGEDAEWRDACVARCARFRWAVRHPLADGPWPRDCWKLPHPPAYPPPPSPLRRLITRDRG